MASTRHRMATGTVNLWGENIGVFWRGLRFPDVWLHFYPHQTPMLFAKFCLFQASDGTQPVRAYRVSDKYMKLETHGSHRVLASSRLAPP